MIGQVPRRIASFGKLSKAGKLSVSSYRFGRTDSGKKLPPHGRLTWTALSAAAGIDVP